METFRFKHFEINQDNSAAKVGTDGVLLGAWISLEKRPESILDVGTGTGLIALMMAQRSDAELIDAVEIDDAAFEEAVENFEQSQWSDRLFCYYAPFKEFVEEMRGEQQYDLIVSNPPFHPPGTSSNNNQRELARKSVALPLEELVNGAANLLSPTGTLGLVLPISEKQALLNSAKANRLFPHRITSVRGHEAAPVKRVLIELGKRDQEIMEKELVLELRRHHYTPEYASLVQNFYLNL